MDNQYGIWAKVVADSINDAGVRLTTIECSFHRFMLAELSKHRVFSMSASSSRAIPVAKIIEQVREFPALPVHWGAKQKGMQADNECDNRIVVDYNDYNYIKMAYEPMPVYQSRERAWEIAIDNAAEIAERFDEAGYHKQIVNRLLEPFVWQKAVITSTEWDNFFRLRIHKDAQPEIRMLAEAIQKAMQESTPKYNIWHLPYENEMQPYWCNLDKIKFASARCAASSYRTEALILEKAQSIFSVLVESELVHSVPLEHVAFHKLDINEVGYTHKDRNGILWSGNFREWNQYRQIYEQDKARK